MSLQFTRLYEFYTYTHTSSHKGIENIESIYQYTCQNLTYFRALNNCEENKEKPFPKIFHYGINVFFNKHN